MQVGENSLCNLFKCPKYIFFDDKKELCNRNNPKQRSCFQTNPPFIQFYDLLDWTKLVTSIEVQRSLDLFKTVLMNDDNIKSLLEICYGFNDYAEERLQNYTEFLKSKNDFTKLTLEQMSNDFLAFDVKQSENNFCEDFIITCSLYYKNPNREFHGSYNLFHISLHPEATGFEEKILENGKKIKACKTPIKFITSMKNYKNLFHYSINNIARPKKEVYEISNSKQPFKEFYLDNDAIISHNKPFFLVNDDDFTLLNRSLMDDVQIQQIYSRDKLDNVRFELLNKLHNLIYNKFVVFWNDRMCQKFLKRRFIVGGIKKTKKRIQMRQNNKKKRKQKRTRRKY